MNAIRQVTLILASALLAPAVLALSGNVAPADSLRQFQIEPGLKIELVAAEPVVAAPVALCFDEQGLLYVAENRDYPTGPASGAAPDGRIARLEDADGDGQFEKRSEFASGLTFPNGVFPWRGGLIVTCAPDILYFKDTDGDGRADEKRVLLTGFNTQGSTQLRVSHPMLGAEGFIYLTSGWSGRSKIAAPGHPERPVLETASDTRFDPFTLEVFAADGRAQFGQTFDDFQNRFICYNRVQVQHVVLPSRYLKRNPNLAFSRTVQDVPKSRVRDWLPHEEGLASRTYPISENITTYDSHAGTFSAACSVHIYRGDALPREFYGNAFSCDPTGNLVHRDILAPHGATFSSHMAHEGREFFASPDNWFRPVFLAEGPDGALYVCDMYRKTIEHPDYLPPETRKHTDFDTGRNLGRIWRITAGPRKKARLPFAGAGPAELACLLDHPNGWHRDTAQRLLIERNSRDAVVPLHTLLQRNASPAARIPALHLLRRFGALPDAAILKALSDASAGVREAALRLAEERMTSNPGLADSAVRLADDRDARVRFQAALSLGSLGGDAPLFALARIAAREGNDEWTRAAVLSSVPGRAAELLFALGGNSAEPGPEMLFDLGRLAGLEVDAAAISKIMPRLAEPQFSPAEAIPAVNGVLDSARRRAIPADPPASLAEPARTLAMAKSAPVAERSAAVRFLLDQPLEGQRDTLLKIFAPDEPAELQETAIRAIARASDPALARDLLEPQLWRTLTPAARGTIVAVYLSQARHAGLLLDAVAAGRIPAGVLTARQREQLRNYSDPAIKVRARTLLEATGGDRMAAYEKVKAALALTPRPENGRKLFAAHCASCHRLDRQGVVVGPELVGMRHQPKEVLLLHVVHPNFEVAPAFTAYEVETTGGRHVTGLLSSETEAGVTLRQAQGIEETIPRPEIKTIAASALSLMPDELEKNMSAQELSDLISYLKGEQ